MRKPKNLNIVSVWHISEVIFSDILGLKAHMYVISNIKWWRKIIETSTSIMFGSCRPGLTAGQPKMSHTNKMSFFRPSQKILKIHAWCSANIVYICDYEVWVHLISHYFSRMKLGNLKCDFMSHTNEIWLLVRNPINAVEMSIKLTYIV